MSFFSWKMKKYFFLLRKLYYKFYAPTFWINVTWIFLTATCMSYYYTKKDRFLVGIFCFALIIFVLDWWKDYTAGKWKTEKFK